MKTGKLNYKLNQQIRASELRVIDDEGRQVGVMSTSAALAKAAEAGLDLVEIAPTAKPPVAKIVEIGKFIYQEEKKKRKEKKKSKPSELKEIRLSPFIADHDFETRLERIAEFLENKHKVRVVVVFTGRQLNSKNFGYEVLGKVARHFAGSIVIDMDPKFFGRHLAMVISPVNKPRVEKKEILEKTENAEI